MLIGQHRLRGGLSQALLINRSPRLEGPDTAALARLRAHPATNDHHGEMLFALQRAAAGLGHFDPPVGTGRMHVPTIQGADPAWTGWVERWHATSTLTRKVRGIIRTIPAKAGRWLATEHREITEPEQWTRQTCQPGSRRSTGCTWATTCNAPTASPAVPARRSRPGLRRTC